MARYTLLLILFAFHHDAIGSLYKCQKDDGKVEYQSTPCVNARQTELKPPPAAERNETAATKQRCSGKELSINFHNMSVGATLQVLADFSGKKLTMTPPVNAMGAFHYTCVPWDTVLIDIATKYKLNVKIENDTILVTPR